jgi:hypothetical protein
VSGDDDTVREFSFAEFAERLSLPPGSRVTSIGLVWFDLLSGASNNTVRVRYQPGRSWLSSFPDRHIDEPVTADDSDEAVDRWVTKSGRVLREQELDTLVAEAEQGYDVSRLAAANVHSLPSVEERLRRLAAKWRSQAKHPQRRFRPEEQALLNQHADELLSVLLSQGSSPGEGAGKDDTVTHAVTQGRTRHVDEHVRPGTPSTTCMYCQALGLVPSPAPGKPWDRDKEGE